MRWKTRRLFKRHIYYGHGGLEVERPLQICNGLVWPVGVFDLVQLGLGEGVVQVLDGHLVEGDHVLELGQLGGGTDRRTNQNMFSHRHFVVVLTKRGQTVSLPLATRCWCPNVRPLNYFLSRQEA